MRNPKVTIRRWVQDQLEDGDLDELDDLVVGALERFIQDPAFCEELARYEIQQCVRAAFPVFAQQIRTQPEQLRREIAEQAPSSPFAALAPSKEERNIVIDVANMTKFEVLTFAQEIDAQAADSLHNAAFLRVLASQLNNKERVAERFSREDLYRMKSRITINPKTEIFVGEKLHSIAQGKVI